MKFTLFYNGVLKANGSVKDKHKIRLKLHEQLEELWKHYPLCNLHNNQQIIKLKIGDYEFVPVVSSEIDMTAEIHITLLRPGLPGSIFTEGGDIDNRLKTLLDALSVPEKPEALPNRNASESSNNPIYTLLENDALITGISVYADRLLEPAVDKSYVRLMLKVNTINNRANLSGIP